MYISNTCSLLAAALIFRAGVATAVGRRLQAAPWDIEFLSLDVDFSMDSGDDELVATYSIGKNRVYETDLLASDCETSITGINITLVDSTTPVDATTDLLTLTYDFNKTEISLSNIWNATTNQIEICQVVQLTIPSAGPSPKMVIAEDKRTMDIDFDLSVNFAINNSLGEETIESESRSTNVTDYVESCKCGGMNDFTCNADALAPSTELFICVKSISADVEIDFLDSMSATQGLSTLDVIENDAVSFPTITSRQYNANENGVMVSTWIPTNLFNFAAGEAISIAGVIEMKLAGSGRRLHDGTESTSGGGESEIASSFELEVALQTKEIVYDEDSSVNAATAISSKSIAILGMIFSLAITMR